MLTSAPGGIRRYTWSPGVPPTSSAALGAVVLLRRGFADQRSSHELPYALAMACRVSPSLKHFAHFGTT
eukprot:CAMPEP_0174942524 /NCGR_PEP_ID=MMETSP1355-20121228/74554_1 /TAXON_ID=464990 /ORGANISM="Hemiselmis tepida, Strain CCMP443" /LENGTH=68 /DNA_ID=CAMNT_0016189703 /DNA_START=38 /DNA_END=244 /DNA_ORIENTATION=-